MPLLLRIAIGYFKQAQGRAGARESQKLKMPLITSAYPERSNSILEHRFLFFQHNTRQWRFMRCFCIFQAGPLKRIFRVVGEVFGVFNIEEYLSPKECMSNKSA